jgi:phenylpropionate dioxygenase-like ring-hydroxylating dioxygenase large terminal subunit
MFKNFWWPLEFSHEVSSKPKRVKALGQDFALYRTTDNRARVLSDLCVHRGAALSGGWVEGNCIVCPYHGWQYEPGGQCVKIPANPPGDPISKKARVDSYPVVERFGFVWAFLGDLPEAERPPLPKLPHYDNSNLKKIYGSYTWKVNYERALENSLDIAHAPFVHGGAFGNRDEPEVPEYELEQDEWSAVTEVTLKPPPAKGLWSRIYKSKKPQGVRTRAGFFMPCVTLLEVNLPLGLMVLLNFHIPIDEYTTITKWINMRSFFKGDWADGDARKRVLKIFEQDRAVLEAVRPELIPFDLSGELHVKSDANQIAYRRMRQKLIERGWGIDARRIQTEYAHRQYTVIPSPARREAPELARAWQIKEVPIQGGKENGAS